MRVLKNVPDLAINAEYLDFDQQHFEEMEIAQIMIFISNQREMTGRVRVAINVT